MRRDHRVQVGAGGGVHQVAGRGEHRDDRVPGDAHAGLRGPHEHLVCPRRGCPRSAARRSRRHRGRPCPGTPMLVVGRRRDAQRRQLLLQRRVAHRAPSSVRGWRCPPPSTALQQAEAVPSIDNALAGRHHDRGELAPRRSPARRSGCQGRSRSKSKTAVAVHPVAGPLGLPRAGAGRPGSGLPSGASAARASLSAR